MTVERNLNLFEEDRTEEGKSKSKKLASEVLGKATVKTETSDVAKGAASGSSAVKGTPISSALGFERYFSDSSFFSGKLG